jgi:leucyl aminopeptidase
LENIMGMKRFAPAALLLWGVTPVLAHAQAVQAISQQAEDREQWITIGADTEAPVLAALRGAGWVQPSTLAKKNGIVALKVRESHLPVIGEVMHDKFNRCAGFMAHDSQADAMKALEATPPPPVQLVDYTIDNAATVNALTAEMAEPNIRGTITTLSNYHTRYYTSTTGVDAANWIRNTWATLAAGRTDVTVANFTHPTWAQPSVIMTITGTTLPNEVVVIGGHLDSINGSTGRAPGADDDASGIASITEIIRSAMVKGYRPARTVKFMGYAAEEVGLRGSAEIAAWHVTNGVNVVGVLQLDMTNYHGSSVDVGLMTDFTNAAQNTFVTNLLDFYGIATWATSACGYGCSDHASWHNRGFATSMPFEALMNQHNNTIHTTNDTIAQSAGMATHALKFSKLGAAFMAELAKGTVPGIPSDTTPPMAAISAPTAGATVTGTTTISANASDNVAVNRVEFVVDGVFKGSDTSAPYSYSWDTAGLPNGSHTLLARAVDSSNNIGTSTIVTVTVSNTSVVASYDPTRGAPTCANVNAVCDSGTLLNGRNNLGPEVNKPNTINSSCQDGSRGVYHSDESLDKLRVATVDGTPFGAGKQVRIEATVWAYASYTSDRLDLYYTANANSPTWTFLGTFSPTRGGSQVLSATYTLPAGALQAVRGRFRYSGTANSCGTGSYDDHDDLIFAVSP